MLDGSLSIRSSLSGFLHLKHSFGTLISGVFNFNFLWVTVPKCLWPWTKNNLLRTICEFTLVYEVNDLSIVHCIDACYLNITNRKKRLRLTSYINRTRFYFLCRCFSVIWELNQYFARALFDLERKRRIVLSSACTQNVTIFLRVIMKFKIKIRYYHFFSKRFEKVWKTFWLP